MNDKSTSKIQEKNQDSSICLKMLLLPSTSHLQLED